MHTLIGNSAAMRTVRGQIEACAPSSDAVLIVGEPGTGKDLCAAAIAYSSGRQPLVRVSCATLPDQLAERELFGHQRGSPGMVTLAVHGVLFLDEPAELSPRVQEKLLAALESGARIVAAISGDPDQTVASGRLRSDFLRRLSTVRIVLPALRLRLEDIPPLVDHFLLRYRERFEIDSLSIAAEACAVLMQHEWPGNVRQLRDVTEAAAGFARDDRTIRLSHVLKIVAPLAGTSSRNGELSLAQARKNAEQRVILEALGQVGGHRERAAKLLRISPATLYRKLGGI